MDSIDVDRDKNGFKQKLHTIKKALCLVIIIIIIMKIILSAALITDPSAFSLFVAVIVLCFRVVLVCARRPA